MTTKNKEGEEKHPVGPVPELLTKDAILRLVTEVIHDMRPQPDPATIKDILAALQAKLHGEK